MNSDNDSRAMRLREAREKAGFADAADFAREAGIKEVTYRAYENGQNGYAKHAASFAKRLKVSAEWLLEGVGTPPKHPDQQSTQTIDAGETVEIVQLDLSLSMGPGTIIDDWTESEPVTFDLAFIRNITRSPPGRLRLVTGIGRSMEPTLQNGDTVMIDTLDRQLARQDGIYWVSIYGAAGIKRLRTIGQNRVLVISDNKDVDSQEVPLADLRIEGRAIWAARGL